MALLRKLFFRKPPDGLLEICERVYVFDCCFTTDAWEVENFRVYIGGIIGQLREHLPDASFLAFNFREGEAHSLMADILSGYNLTIMDYPRHYEGCPVLTVEVLHHFLRSCESWLSLGQQNVLLMHCERGGWPVLAFMLAALLLYRKQYSGEQRTLDMVYRQAPRELVQLLSPLNPVPSQLRYLQYVSRRSLATDWPPLDRALTLDCVILRYIPNFDGEGGCRPIFRIYGQDPFLVSDKTSKVLYSTPKGSKICRSYKQAECELVKIDINCHIQGDVVLECINLDDNLKHELMMFRVMFNTAFIRSNILILNRDDIDILWDAKEQFPRDFRAEILFSEMDAAASVVANEVALFDEEGLPIEVFAKVHEMFSHVDWLDAKVDVALKLQQLAVSSLHDKPETGSPQSMGGSPSAQGASPGKFQEKTKPAHLELEGETKIQEKIQSLLTPQQSADIHQTGKETKGQEHDSCFSEGAEVYSAAKPLVVPDSTYSHLAHSKETESVLIQSPKTPPPPPPPLPAAKFPHSPLSISTLPLPPPLPPHDFAEELQSSSNKESSISSGNDSQLPGVRSVLQAKSPLSSSASTDVSVLPPSLAAEIDSSNQLSPHPPPPPPPPAPPLKENMAARAVSGSSNQLLQHHPPPSPPPPLKEHMAVKALSSPSPVPPPPPPSPPPPPFPIPRSPSIVHAVGSPVVPPPPPLPVASRQAEVGAVSSLASPVPPPPPHPVASGKAEVGAVSSTAPPPPPPPATDRGVSPPVPSAPPPPASFPRASKSGDMAAGSPYANISGSPTPPPPSISPSGLKGRSLSRSMNPKGNITKKLKPLHWLKLSRAVQGSLWAEAQKSGEASNAPEIDISELENLFSAAVPASDASKKSSSRSSVGNKPEKVQLIEHRRAYNCEIMLSKVKVPLHDLMCSVLALEDSALDVDQVENLIKFCPTKEEMELLKGYTGEKEKLGKCEQFFLELMQVPRVESKLRVFSFKMQFNSQVSDLRNSLSVVNSASEEIRNSVKLKRIMQTILSLGNALNQGTARGSAIGFRLDSLLKLTETRARNNKMTLMHYLCKVLADKLPEVLDFSKDLANLEPASKLQLKVLAEEMQAISKGLEKVVQELSSSENDGPISDNFSKILKDFLRFAEAEVRCLASLYSAVGRNVDSLILYFGEDPARCPFEQVVSTLLNFVKMFNRAHEENCKQHELEMKRAAESEKVKAGAPHKETEHLLHTPIKSSNIK